MLSVSLYFHSFVTVSLISFLPIDTLFVTGTWMWKLSMEEFHLPSSGVARTVSVPLLSHFLIWILAPVSGSEKWSVAVTKRSSVSWSLKAIEVAWRMSFFSSAAAIIVGLVGFEWLKAFMRTTTVPNGGISISRFLPSSKRPLGPIFGYG